MKHFNEIIARFGENDKERAAALAIPTRTLTRYKKGIFPPILIRLMAHPQLLEALLKDAKDALEEKEER